MAAGQLILAGIPCQAAHLLVMCIEWQSELGHVVSVLTSQLICDHVLV